MSDDTPIWQAAGQQRFHFVTSDQLWAAAIRYFEWVCANPLYEHKPFSIQGEIRIERIARMRAMSLTGLLVFLGIGKETWAKLTTDPEFSHVANRILGIIHIQKLEGAAADLLNATIVQRELGHQEKGDQPIQTMSDEELDAKITEIAKAGAGRAGERKGKAKGQKPAGRLSAIQEAKRIPRCRRKTP